MTNSNTLIKLLGQPYTTIISTWDIVITPQIALSLVQLDAEQQGHDEEATIHAVLPNDNLAFIVGGFDNLQASLDEHQERCIKCIAYDPTDDAIITLSIRHERGLALPIERALDGFTRYRFESDPFVWEYMSNFDASDLQIAEKLNEPLRVVKRVRLLKDGLSQCKLKVPETWQEALQLTADKAPQLFNRDLLAAYNQCV